MGLVLLGLGLLAVALGLARGVRRPAPARPPLGSLLATAALAVVAGLAGLARPRTYVAVAEEPPAWSPGRVDPGFSVLACTPGQLADLGLVAVGVLLVLGCVGFAVGRGGSRRRAAGA